jgi:UDP-N-acetylglucosamine 2-epimerase
MVGILREISPDVVLVTSAPRAERAAVLAARQLQIPSVVVVDLFALTELDVLKDPTFGEVICVLTGSVRDRLVAAGRPPEHIQVTGNPVFDRLADPLLRTRGLDLRNTRQWSQQRVITWASQPEPSDPQLPRRIEATLIAALAKNPTWHLVIRPHPSDTYPLPAPHSRLTLSTRADDVHTLLAASDVVVTMTSTVGLEAVLLGKPLVTWDRSENTQFCPYSAMGLSRGVTDLSRLAEVVNQAALGQCAAPELPIIGQACAAVVAVVERYVQSSAVT